MATEAPDKSPKEKKADGDDNNEKKVPSVKVPEGKIDNTNWIKILASVVMLRKILKDGKYVDSVEAKSGSDADGQTISTADTREPRGQTVRDARDAEELIRGLKDGETTGDGKSVAYAIPVALTNASTGEVAKFITTDGGVKVMRDMYGDPIHNNPPTYQGKPISDEDQQAIYNGVTSGKLRPREEITDSETESVSGRGSPRFASSRYDDEDENHGVSLLAHLASGAVSVASGGLLTEAGNFIASRVGSKRGRESFWGDAAGSIVGSLAGAVVHQKYSNALSSNVGRAARGVVNNLIKKNKRKEARRDRHAGDVGALPSGASDYREPVAQAGVDQPTAGDQQAGVSIPPQGMVLGVSAAAKSLSTIKALEKNNNQLGEIEKKNTARHAEVIKTLKMGFHLEEYAPLGDLIGGKKKKSGGGLLGSIFDLLKNSWIGKALLKIPGVGKLVSLLAGLKGLGFLGGAKALAKGAGGLVKTTGKLATKLATRLPLIGKPIAAAGGALAKLLPGFTRSAASVVENGLISSGSAGAQIARGAAGVAGAAGAEGAGSLVSGIGGKMLGQFGSALKVGGPIAGLIAGVSEFLNVKNRQDLSTGQKAARVGGRAGGAAVGTALGAAALAWVPVVGPLVGGFVGGWLGDKFGSKIGQFLSDNYKPLKKAVTGIAGVIGAVGKGIGNVTATALKGSAKLLGKAAEVIFPVGPLVKLASQEITNIAPTVKEAFKKVTSFVSDKVSKIFSSFKEGVTNLFTHPIDTITKEVTNAGKQALNAATSVVSLAFGKETAEKFHKAVTDIFTSMKDGFLSTANKILGGIGDFFKGLGDKAAQAWQGAKNIAQGAVSKVKQAMAPVTKMVTNVAETVNNRFIDPAVTKVKQVAAVTAKAVNETVNVAKDKLQGAATVVNETVVQPVKQAAKKAAKTVNENVVQPTKAAVQKAGTEVGKQWDKFKEAVGLGSVSAKYESGKGGAGTISTGRGDLGGASYGAHQLSSKTGTLTQYLNQSKYGKEFAGLQQGSAEFNAKWKELAKNDVGFGKDQDAFITKTHFDPVARYAQGQGLDVKGSRALQEAVYSLGVQYGAGGAKSKLDRAFKGQDLSKLSDQQAVDLLYKSKLANVEKDFKSSPQLWAGIRKRIENEWKDVSKLAGKKPDEATDNKDSDNKGAENKTDSPAKTAENNQSQTAEAKAATPTTQHPPDSKGAAQSPPAAPGQPQSAPQTSPASASASEVSPAPQAKPAVPVDTRTGVGDDPTRGGLYNSQDEYNAAHGVTLSADDRAKLVKEGKDPDAIQAQRRAQAVAQRNAEVSKVGQSPDKYARNRLPSQSASVRSGHDPVLPVQAVVPPTPPQPARADQPHPPSEEQGGGGGGSPLPMLSDIQLSPLDPALLKLNTGGFER